ncbi:MAG: hypothetical protein ACE5FK_03370 [Candidatus Methylomirabilia bacterium]
MRRTARWWLSIVGLLAVGVILWLPGVPGARAAGEKATVVAAGILPATPLPLVDGGTLNLQSLKGQVVVIRFLASW